MRVFIRSVAFLFVATILCFSTKSFGQCATTLTLTADPILPSGGYAPGTTVTFTLNIGQYTQVASNWLHGVTVDFGEGWDSSSFVVVQPANTCSGSGYWDYYATVQAEGSGLTLGPGFFYDFDNQFVPADGNPGNNYGDENASGFCSWTFVWQITTDSLSTNVQPNGSIVIYGDGTSGYWNNSMCGGDYNDINGLVDNTGCNASFSVTGSAFANWPLTFEQVPFAVDWDSARWWTADSSYTGFELQQTFDLPGLHSVCLAVYDGACADTACVEVNIQPNPLPFNASVKAFGFLFYDLNTNGAKEPNEPGVQIPLRVDSTDLIAYPTSNNGRFTFYTAHEGTYNILPYDTSIFHITTQPFNPLALLTGVNFIGEVGIVADTAFADFEFLNANAAFRCDSVSSLNFGLRNKGSNELNGYVKLLFRHNNIVINATSIDTSVSVSNDTLVIPVDDLQPFAYTPIEANLANPFSPGDSLQWDVWWNVTDGNVVLTGSRTFAKIIDCVSELVEKEVTPQNATPENLTLRNTPLTYTLGFQHEASDSVQRVVILDTLSGDLNPASLYVSNAPYLYEAMREGNVLKVVLPEVALYNFNRGFLTYNVNHEASIPNNTAIHNTAFISIDGAPALSTNNALVTIIDSAAWESVAALNNVNWSLQPNPTDAFLELTTDQPLNALVEVYDALGNVMFATQMRGTHTQLDVRALAAGVYACRLTAGLESQRFMFVKQ